jgi:hypothetical protein
MRVQYLHMYDLGKLFGSPARLKILRYFAFNPEAVVDRDDVAKSCRVTPETASRELASLARAGYVKRKTYYREGSRSTKKRRVMGWALNQQYPYLAVLTTFLAETVSVSHADIRKRLKGIGSVRLMVLSGIFTGAKESILDLMFVGDRLNEAAIAQQLRTIEAELGKEIRYAVLQTDDYLYRRRVRDKLVRDVLDYPHEALVDRISS